ncbi:MAG: CRISPR system precrRNA processing endoribonuclease RAMP protein Cas6 [Epsilonproteobacteria bacterium]|nr:CRISPR system precrRNA processing endoribonuclease RAMP protein Cas6 [Campylobacterota bacterium]
MTHTKITIIFKAKPPYFIGSQLRGAFGHALKRVTCINPAYECDGCFASANCLYHEFYEAKNEAHKYRFDFELGKSFYEFNLYLFDTATAKLPYVVSALHMMLTQIGLGKEKQTFNDFELYINDESAMIGGKLKLPSKHTQDFETPQPFSHAKIKLLTPLRIKKENRYVRDDSIELYDIVNSVYQRQMQLLGRGHKKFPYEVSGEVVKKELYFKELTRQSNRQKTTMNLGGVMGEIEIKNIDEKSCHVLKLGELLACGKSTVFGLGKIEVEAIDV